MAKASNPRRFVDQSASEATDTLRVTQASSSKSKKKLVDSFWEQASKAKK